MERTTPRHALAVSATEGRLPSLDAYIESLPQGWSSYPSCEARSVLLASLRPTGALAELEDVPILVDHVRSLASSEWVPEVAHVAILLALRDHRFPGPTGEAGFVAWMDKLNRSVLPTDPHRSVNAALADLPAIWASLHRGTSVDLIENGPNRATLGLLHPDRLFPPLARRWRRRVIESYLAGAGASQPRAYETTGAGEQLSIVITWR